MSSQHVCGMKWRWIACTLGVASALSSTPQQQQQVGPGPQKKTSGVVKGSEEGSTTERRMAGRRMVLGVPGLVMAHLKEPAMAATTAAWLKDVPVESLEDAASKFEETPTSSSRESLLDGQPKEKEAVAVSKARERALVGRSSGGGGLKVTERVRLSARVARSDGTFASRDDDPEPPVAGDLELAIYGDAAPANAALFLDFAARTDALGYARSTFDQVVDGGALVVGGRVRGLDDRDLFGEKILVYRDQEVLNTKTDRLLLTKARSEMTPIPHDRAGLVTRRRLSDDPADLVLFGLTLRPAPELDRDWTVVGSVVKDDAKLLPTIAQLPIYSPQSTSDSPIAASVFQAQYGAFRSVAAAVGDSRVSNVFPGKILRRVEITRSVLRS